MDKKTICVIGTGGCGGKLLSELLKIDSSYNSIYSNSNFKEMEGLYGYDPHRNVLYINASEGTGRDRSKAEEYIKLDQSKIVSFFANKFPESSGINTFFIVSSADGGQGSGSVFMFAKVIKNINPNAIVNLLIAMPSLDEKEASLSNTLGFYEDFKEAYKRKLINSVQWIDNNKLSDNENEFNEMVMEQFDNSLSINNEVIDYTDSSRVNCCRGYKVALNLDNKFKDMQESVDNAIKTSPFVVPNKIDEPEIMMASFIEDDYNKEDAKVLFEAWDLDKYDYNEDKNMIVLGGCPIPKDYMELVASALNDLQRKKAKKKKEQNLDLESEVVDLKSDKTDSKPKQQSSGVSRSKLRELMKDSTLWD